MPCFLMHIPDQEVTLVYASYTEARKSFFAYCKRDRNLSNLALWAATDNDAEPGAQRTLLAYGGQGLMRWIKHLK